MTEVATSAPEMLADYGDGLLHWFGRYGPKSTTLSVARCRAHDDVRPAVLYLPRKAPEVKQCPYCVAGERKPRSTGRQAKVREGRTPNAPIRAAFEASGMSLSEVAIRMGMTRRYSQRRTNGSMSTYLGAETSRLQRMLGLRPNHRWRNGAAVKQHNISVVNAAKVLRALHLDPHDFDL